MNIAHIINRYINVLYFTYLITHTLYSRGKDSEKRSVFAFALCCHSNTTRAPIANPPNSAQLGGIPYHSPKLHPGPCNSVGMRPRTDRQTQTDTQTRVTTIHFASSTTRAKCNEPYLPLLLSRKASLWLVLISRPAEGRRLSWPGMRRWYLIADKTIRE